MYLVLKKVVSNITNQYEDKKEKNKFQLKVFRKDDILQGQYMRVIYYSNVGNLIISCQGLFSSCLVAEYSEGAFLMSETHSWYCFPQIVCTSIGVFCTNLSLYLD